MTSAAMSVTGFLGWPSASNASVTIGMITLLRTGTDSVSTKMCARCSMARAAAVADEGDRLVPEAEGDKHAVDRVLQATGDAVVVLSQVEDDLFRALNAEERATLHGLLARTVEAQAPGGVPGACAGADPGPCAGADCVTGDAGPG
jgi:hypothetical protein